MIVAALQYNAKDNIDENIACASALITKAAKAGARLICLPECANFLAKNKNSLFANAETEQDSAFLKMAQTQARAHNCYLSLGSLMMRQHSPVDGDNRIANRHYIIAPTGAITARYDKIHMFDAQLGDGKSYKESASFRPGIEPVMTQIDGLKAGLSICYDIRFAGLFHHYAAQSADLILTPAAFTATTGAAHWHVLQRARAIETGAFIIAAAQMGTHDDGRQTYGHALIIDPWGEVLDDAGATGDMAIAEIDSARITTARQALSAWQSQTHFK